MGMSQSEWIGAAIIAGFLIFLAMKGKLATYWRMLTGGAIATKGGAGGTAGGGAGSTIGGILGGLAGPGLGNLGSVLGGAVSGEADASAIPGAIGGTITQGGVTSPTSFPAIPGGMLSLPGVKF